MRVGALLIVAVLAASCATGGRDADGEGPSVPDDYRIEVVTSGLERPTQMTIGPDGRLWAAQLAGAEDAGTGEVVAVDLAGGEPEVLLEGLDKPTGLAVMDDAVWVVQVRTLLRAPLAGASDVGEPEVVLDRLPYNGRSLGTLTSTGGDKLLFNTSGARDGGEVVEGSATLWELDPQSPGDPEPVARGLQNAYAHTVDPQERRWATEIHDGTYDEHQAPDEVVRVRDGADYGWPRCIADGAPVQEYGGNTERCGEVDRPVALLEAGATPTGLVASPFAEDELLVALWGLGEVVTVDVAGGPGEQPTDPQGLVQDLRRPQDLLVHEGGVLISDHAEGIVYELTKREE